MMEILVRVGFHGDAEDVLVWSKGQTVEDAVDRAFDWFDQDHEGPGVLEAEPVELDTIPMATALAASHVY